MASAPPTAPAAPPAPTPRPDAVPGWQSRLLAELARARRYPEGSRARAEEGVVLLAFTLDRAGRVLAASIARSSGYPDLDAEALALLRRAEPLPPPPPELPGDTVPLRVPIRFNLR